MTKLFKKLFIKNYKNTENQSVRVAYGIAAGTLGIVANLILFIAKLLVGIFSFSVAVIADAINNLSDFITSTVTIIGFKISGRPADKEHPFGHERMEYVTSLIVSCVIFFIGIETGRAGVEKILNAGTSEFSLTACIILGATILIKICLAIIFKGLGKSINSDALYAMSTDSINDVFSTIIILICAIISMLTNLPLDGYLGVLVSVLVILSAIKLIKETIDPLIGATPNKELINKIEDKLKGYDGILDIHDLIVHNYGPTKTFATVHIEVDASIDIMLSHDLSDNIERDFYKELGVCLVCHLDPVSLNDNETNFLKEELDATLKSYNNKLSLHDFRVVSGNTHTNVIFDVVLPFDLHGKDFEIRKLIDDKLATYPKRYYAVIEFDKSFN